MVWYDLAHQIRCAKHAVVGVISHLWCAARLVGIAHHSFYSVEEERKRKRDENYTFGQTVDYLRRASD